MAKFRMVHTEFWTDAKVLEEMTPEDKYFYLYLLTNPNTTQIGIYQITKKQIAFDLGYSIESVNSLMKRFIEQHKVIRYNPETRELAIRNWGKYNLIRGGKPMLDCVRSELKEVKDVSLIKYVGENVSNSNIKQIFDTYHDTLTYRGQEKEEEEEKEEDKEKQEEVKNGNVGVGVDAVRFYEQNYGFLNGFIIETIDKWCEDLSEELVIEAMKIALKNQKPWSYAEGILRNWVVENVKNLNDVKALNSKRQGGDPGAVNRASNPESNKYDYGF